MQWLLPVSLAFEILGFYCYGIPIGADQAHSVLAVAGSFFLFLFWLISLISWGIILSALFKIKRDGANFLWLGSLFLGLCIFPLSLVGQLKMGPPPLALFILVLGPLLCFIGVRYKKLNEKLPFPQWKFWRLLDHLGLLALSTVFCLSLLQSFYPHSFTDPLSYHLLAARKWVQQGSLALPLNDPNVYLASTWELLYCWPQMLLGGTSGGGLLLAQLFSQWIHVVVGGAGSLLCLAIILQKFFSSIPRAFVFMALLVALTGIDLNPSLSQANNDWGIAFWLLAPLAGYATGRAPLWLVGLGLGLAATAKFSSLFCTAGMLLLIVWENKRGRDLVHLAFAFGLGAAPALLRNYFGTSDPFYPALSKIFPVSVWGPTWQGISAYEGGNLEFSRLSQRLWDLMRQSLFCVGLLALPIAPKIETRTRVLSLLLIFSYFLFSLKSGSKAEPRLFGAGLLLLTSFGYLLSVSLFWKKGSKRVEAFLLVSSLTFVTLTQVIPWRAPQIIWQMEGLPQELRKHSTGPALAWIRLNAKPDTKILSVSETRLYYMIPQNMERLWDDKDLDERASQVVNAREFFSLLSERKFEWVLITHALFDTIYSEKVWNWVNQASQKNPGALLFSTPSARIISVSKYLELTKSTYR